MNPGLRLVECAAAAGQWQRWLRVSGRAAGPPGEDAAELLMRWVGVLAGAPAVAANVITVAPGDRRTGVTRVRAGSPCAQSDSHRDTAACGALLALAVALVPMLSCAVGPSTGAATVGPRPLSQFPSPMVDTTRAHERLPAEPPPGHQWTIDAGLPRPLVVFLPEAVPRRARLRLLIHFHGAAQVVMHAAARAGTPTLAVSVHLGAGSTSYEQPFSDEGALDRVLRASLDAVAGHWEAPPAVEAVHLSAFSAGYGAIRTLARRPEFLQQVSGVLLLDGLHGAYVPEGRVLAAGGRIDETALEPFVTLARAAIDRRITLVITHSEVFPGTFASTTEMTDAILARLTLRRTPVLEWGPLGMQQLSEARQGRLVVLGFAGNTAPDHVDHLHALPAFAQLLVSGRD